MPPNVAELLAAIPHDERRDERSTPDFDFQGLLSTIAQRSVPTGSFRRLWTLGGLQARIGLAYLAYWLRSWFQHPDRRQQLLLDTHLASAFKLLETMGYLRGAVIKVGQAAANLPEVVPDEFVDTLGKLHFEAPPMHYSLIEEFVHNELGGDPLKIFETFETTAFAAASLGQVHRARLKSGEHVAVKVQYPGIARTIRCDFRNLHGILFPFRFSRDWDNLKAQFEEIERMFELETDYEIEARFLGQARALFREDDNVVVPRVFDQYSTRRILTMEYLDGQGFYDFVDSDPPQQLRNHYGTLLVRAMARLVYAGRMEYGDPHPGNVVFLDGDRLGLIDFGCMRVFNDQEWEYMRLADEACHGSREQLVDVIRRGTDFTEEELANTEMLDVMVEYSRWLWEPMVTDGLFDYGDASHIQRGIDIIRRFSEHARPRQKPVHVFIQRSLLAGLGLHFRLKSQVNVKQICDEEVRVTGWG